MRSPASSNSSFVLCQFAVKAVARTQFVVRSRVDDPPVIHDHDPLGPQDSGRLMGNHQQRGLPRGFPDGLR